MANRYSVYDTRTDMPILIWGTAAQCAAAMRVSLQSFRTYCSLAKKGKGRQKYEIIKHDKSEGEDVLP